MIGINTSNYVLLPLTGSTKYKISSLQKYLHLNFSLKIKFNARVIRPYSKTVDNLEYNHIHHNADQPKSLTRNQA